MTVSVGESGAAVIQRVLINVCILRRRAGLGTFFFVGTAIDARFFLRVYGKTPLSRVV